MNRREFAAALGGVVAALHVPALVDPAIPSDGQVLTGGAGSGDALALESTAGAQGGIIMLPTEGVQQITVCQEWIDITPAFDSSYQSMPGPQYVEIQYWTNEPIPELRNAIDGECRLEAFGYRIDGYINRCQLWFGDARAPVGCVTEVTMMPTGTMERGEQYEHRRGFRR